SALLSQEALESFRHDVKSTRCSLCENRCHLTVNRFDGSRSLISGNRCERPLTKSTAHGGGSLNLYDDKLAMLKAFKPAGNGQRGSLGIPLGLNMFELLPFWHTLFTQLGFDVVTSPLSDRALYLKGQATIPSDTVCFPAKLMHGHIQSLIEQGVDTVFYPCMSYNLDEKLGTNHYNCPVVAYYPEVIGANMPDVLKVRLIKDYVGPHRRRDFPVKLADVLKKYFSGITRREVYEACAAAYRAQEDYLKCVRTRGSEIIEAARRQCLPIVVLAGRPYHIDPETNHGIDRLVRSLGAAVISEDAVSHLAGQVDVDVLNQWTYHARLYAAAQYIKDQPDMHLVQLVSFGCGLDAITADEVRAQLERAGRLYTQLKIDEITNLGAVRIRLRSLFSALEQQKEVCRRS
ncbi:MAG: acyl-CoA dehydratase activase-related protein, partial [Pygmaiobacter sp.]|nr:acyl-CoA dehydratase activase-related protein [Pygmaiobacter sp.]